MCLDLASMHNYETLIQVLYLRKENRCLLAICHDSIANHSLPIPQLRKCMYNWNRSVASGLYNNTIDYSQLTLYIWWVYKGLTKCFELGVWLVGATAQKVAIAKGCFIWHAYPSHAEAIITFGFFKYQTLKFRAHYFDEFYPTWLWVNYWWSINTHIDYCRPGNN